MATRCLRKLLLPLILALFISTPALAQLTTLGTGGGFGSSGGGGGYTGPGDIQAFAHYWGLRCYNNAYSGNVADIWDTATGATTETLLTCSPGGTINQTVHTLATTCAISCSVKTLYDQASTANATWASVALGPTLTVSCANSNPCNVFSSQQLASSAITSGFTTTVYAVGERTGAFGAFNQLDGGDSGSTFQIGWNNAANSVFAYNGGTAILLSGVAESTFHVFIAQFIGTASDAFSIDGGASSTASTGTSHVLAGNNFVLGSQGASPFIGKSTEHGLIAGTVSSTIITNLCHNARLYWGSAGSC